MWPSDRVLAASWARRSAPRLKSRPLPIAFLSILILSTGPRACFSQQAGGAASQTVSLREAIQRTLERNPVLRASAWEVPKAAARLRQAGARSNPDLSFELENFAGSRAGLSASEATLSLRYPIDLGRKRSARIGVARSDQAVTAWNLESRRLEWASEAAMRFLRLQALEATMRLAADEVRGAEEAHATTSLRVRSGAAHSVEERRAEVELVNARLERVQIESQTSLARTRLGSLWGEPEAEPESRPDSADALPDAPSLDTLLTRLETVPSVARWRDEREWRRSELALKRAEGRPEVSVMTGMRLLQDGDERTFLAGVSLPLPLFDRNAGAIATARAAVSQADDEWTSARTQARSVVIEAHSTILRSRRRLTSLRTEVLPGAGRAFEEMRIGFERGRFSYLDLLEARRTWTRARREELDARLEYQLGLVELNRLTSATVAEFTVGIGVTR